MLTGILFGLVPAAGVAGRPPGGSRGRAAQRDGRPERQRLRSALFVSEVALASPRGRRGLLLRSLAGCSGLRVSGPGGSSPSTSPARRANPRSRTRRLLHPDARRLRAFPACDRRPPASARRWSDSAGDRSTWSRTARPRPGGPAERLHQRRRLATFGRSGPAEGRPALRSEDTAESPPVVIINETMSKSGGPTGAARQADQAGFPQDDAPFREIVGVVGDVPQEGLDAGADGNLTCPSLRNLRTR